MIKSKRGEVMVEAALVIPVVILVIVTLLTLLTYFYSCLSDQISLHKNILSKLNNYDRTIGISEQKRETTYETQGLISNIMRKECTARVTYMRESVILRTGDKVQGLI